MKHYVVISSDCHAGPNSPEYRQFLDPQYLEEFDYELAHRDELIAERRAAAGMPATVGCAAAGTPRRATRSSTTTV